jgi:hypothetical protein
MEGNQRNCHILIQSKNENGSKHRDLISNASIEYDSPIENHKLFTNGFKNYQGRVGIDDVIFRYIVRVGKTNKDNIFYDINLEVDGKVPRAYRASLINPSTSDTTLSQLNADVNTNIHKNTKKDTSDLNENISQSRSIPDDIISDRASAESVVRACKAIRSCANVNRFMRQGGKSNTFALNENAAEVLRHIRVRN